MEDEHKISAKTPPLNFQIFPIPSTPFNFIHSTPFSKQLSTSKPRFHLLVGASNAVREAQKSIASNVDKFMKVVDILRCQNGVLDKVLSFPTYLQNCCQIPLRNSQNLSMLSTQNFAAIIPGDAVAGIVVTNGVLNFLNIYNTLLIVRLVLTWFPNAPPAIVSPLSTICDPYLNIFRGIIPPLGGTLDLSPILAFLVLNAFTSTASALPAELPPELAANATASYPTASYNLTTSQKKWMTRVAGANSKRSNADEI
ncbi:hypothetical protein ACS0TY_022507 [Phlomoides rotata]